MLGFGGSDPPPKGDTLPRAGMGCNSVCVAGGLVMVIVAMLQDQEKICVVEVEVVAPKSVTLVNEESFTRMLHQL